MLIKARYPQILKRESAFRGVITGGKLEWKFGEFTDDKTSKPLLLQLGEATDVPVRGSVDRIRVTKGPDGTHAIEILDYKTGKPFAAKLGKSVKAGTLPQLPVYAMALGAITKAGCGIDSIPEKACAVQLTYDFVQDTSPKGLLPKVPGESGLSLEETASLLGWLLTLARKGEYPALPHDLTCPIITYMGHDYCAFQSVCRFNNYPGTVEPTDNTEPTDDMETTDGAQSEEEAS
jgi:hypothetical protein